MSRSLNFTVNVVSGRAEVVELKNARGSIQHYFHFFLGGLLPLINHLVEHGEDRPVCIRTDVGPMHRILEELPIKLGDSPNDVDHSLPGFDCFLDEDIGPEGINLMTPEIRARILDWFERTLPPELDSGDSPKVILVERARDPFFNSANAEVKTSGADRRSISNHNEVKDLLQKKYGNAFRNVVLEKESIYSQYRLFSRADLVVAQHGAALANIFFMSEGSHVVEIAPPWGRGLNMFGNLSRQCRVRYSLIEQQENHSPVDLDALRHILG
ncbi:MAG: glycosyltransferase family 61 protein [Verrucomicrobiales bacterium]|nr:glycosyltransferase family 61 protein [Verrucomicrobiales bacterium]